ncbi:hypothetical protein M9434_002531 [Picochlorum sp. BPE23]|nr:hypothetical protein M9434_002531 [Picochlorum sp. BPE23]
MKESSNPFLLEYQSTIGELTANTLAQIATRGKRESRLWLQLCKVIPVLWTVSNNHFHKKLGDFSIAMNNKVVRPSLSTSITSFVTLTVERIRRHRFCDAFAWRYLWSSF